MIAVGGAIVLAIVGVVNLFDRSTAARPLSPEKPLGVSIPWLSQTVKHWSGDINEMAKKYDVDPNFLAIIITLESGGYTKAASEADAKGLMQITPPAAKDIAAKYLKQPVETYDLFDPKTNIEFGAAYLSYLRDVFGESNQAPSWNVTAELVAAGYNGGPGNAGRLYRGEGLTSVETVTYSRDVYNMWRERHAKTSPTYDRWLERGGSRLINKAKAEQQ